MCCADQDGRNSSPPCSRVDDVLKEVDQPMHALTGSLSSESLCFYQINTGPEAGARGGAGPARLFASSLGSSKRRLGAHQPRHAFGAGSRGEDSSASCGDQGTSWGVGRAGPGDDEFVNWRDISDGNTVLHTAVARKQLELQESRINVPPSSTFNPEKQPVKKHKHVDWLGMQETKRINATQMDVDSDGDYVDCNYGANKKALRLLGMYGYVNEKPKDGTDYDENDEL
ncbi:hypothetical protein FH972_018002 [Carpinus fangiana]|uniref:Uncharacterized protein n=1 Tax=Carpinus fangiana TaxID=176857 RepID=A0A5N6RM10_9ROSI|nr:hypothetical protein FH972_018002 [Carpinus fangiana]